MSLPIRCKARIKRIISHGEGVYTVILNLIDTKARFKPGQFLHLTLEEYEPSQGFWPESRVFSIASPPQSSEIEIVYSVKGSYTKRMSQELCEGKEVWIKLPYGDFIIEKHIQPGYKVVLIAGGTGIAPFISYLRKMKEVGVNDIDISLYYGIRNENLFLYKELIESIRDKLRIRVFKGMIDINEIILQTDKFKSKYFISGPPLMISEFKKTLIRNEVAVDNIIIDDWE